jgi:hypothetical protein
MKYFFLSFIVYASCITNIKSGQSEIVKNESINNEFGNDTTIYVKWLGLSCFCPNWIETKYNSKLESDSLGTIKDEFSISLIPTDSLKDLNKSPLIGKQTPLLLKLKGRFYKSKVVHNSKNLSYTSRTFQYDSYLIIEN